MALSLTKAQAAFKAWAMACPGADEEKTGLFLDHVESMTEEAAKLTCDTAMTTGKWQFLQEVSSATLASDASTGFGFVVLDDKYIPDSLTTGKSGFVKHASFSQPLSFLPNVTDLYYEQPSDEIGYFTVVGRGDAAVIYAAEYDGTAITGSIVISGCTYRTFANLPAQLEDEYLSTLADMCREKLLVTRTNPRLTGSAPPLSL